MTERRSRLAETFEQCRADNRAALVGYLPAGFPTVPKSIEVFETMVSSGCDIDVTCVAYIC